MEIAIMTQPNVAPRSLGWGYRPTYDVIPPKLKSTFQQILNDIKDRKENLERSLTCYS